MSSNFGAKKNILMSLSEWFYAKINKTNEGDSNIENLIKSYYFYPTADYYLQLY